MPNTFYEEYGYNQSTLSNDMQYIIKETKEPQKGADILEAAAKEAITPFAMKRIWDRRSSQFEPEEDWAIDDKTVQDIQAEYTQKDEDYLREAKSENEFVARKRFIEEDRERLRTIGEGGYAGIAAMVGLSLIDPVAITLSTATGGLGLAGQSAGIAKALRIGALSGIENAVLETVLMEGNTQSDWTHVVTAFGAGAAIGGAISPFIRTRNPELVRDADHVDMAINTDANNLIAREIIDNVRHEAIHPISRAYPEIDVRKAQQDIADFEISLTRETEGGLTKGQSGQLNKRIKEVQSKIDADDAGLRQAQTEVIKKRETVSKRKAEFIEEAKLSRESIQVKFKEAIKKQRKRLKVVESNLEKKPDSQKLAAKLWKEETKLDDLLKKQDAEIKVNEKKLKAKVNKAEWRLNRAFAKKTEDIQTRRTQYEQEILDYSEQMERGVRAKQASNNLRKWKRMSDEQKVTALYKGKPPNLQNEVARQIETTKPLPDIIEVPEGAAVVTAAPEAPTVPLTVTTEKGAAGAMMAGQRFRHRIYTLPEDTQQKMTELAYQAGNIPADLRGRRVLPKFVRLLESVHTRLSNSNSMVIRGLTYHLFEAPQGGHAAKVTAATRVKNYSVQIRSAMRNRLNEGLEEWAKEQNIPVLKALLKRDLFNSYHKKVMIEVRKPGTFTDPSIVKGAAGVRDQFKTAGKIRQDAGEQGFEGIITEANYLPIIMDNTLIKHALHYNGDRTVIDLLSLGYQRGAYQLDKKLADRIAEGYVARAKNNTLTMRDYIRTVKDTDIETLSKQLSDAGVEQDVIDNFLEITAERELKQHMSNRAKKSLRPDITVELNGIKFIDLMDTNLPKLLESYTRDAAGGAALAKLGFPTRNSIINFLNDINKHSDNSGLNPIKTAEEIQILGDGIDMLYGRSLNKDPHSPLVKRLSRLRDLTSFLRLQMVGISSIPELARITVQRGLKGTMKACPDLGLGLKGTKPLRRGGKYSGQFKRPDLREMEIAFGYSGEDFVMYPNGLRSDNIEETELYNSLGAKIDNLLAQGRRVQEVISAFRLIQGSGEKIAVRTLSNQLKEWAEGTGKALSKSQINDAGWHDGFLDRFKEWMLANPATEMYEGKSLRLFNFGQMPAEMQERLQVGTHRLISRDMQRPLVGETPVFMHKWLGQTLTQFRSFSLLSLEKQLIHDIRHDRIAGSLIFLHSAMLSYMALTINTLNSAIGREDADDYIKNRLTGANAVLGVFNRMGQTASAGIALDGLATLGALPDDLMAAPGQTGFRGMTTTSAPIIGVVSDVLDVGRDLVDILKGEGDTNKTLRDIQQVIPFGRPIGINQAFNAILE